MADRSVHDVLAEVQHRVNCPKGQYNKFGGFAYRSLEDINAALKPVCEELECSYWFADEIVPLGLPVGTQAEDGDTGRWYLRATVTFAAKGCGETVSATAYAREQESKKGMDSAQITGLASSYARKYAACGLFAIDSGEDPDAMDNGKGPQRRQGAPKKPAKAEGMKLYPDGQNGAQDASQPATDEQLVAVAQKLGEFAALKGKGAQEVMRALNASKTMQAAGVTAETVTYDAAQAAKALAVLDGWIAKSKEA